MGYHTKQKSAVLDCLARHRNESLTVDGVCGCSSWKKITTAVIGIGRTKTTID